VLVTTPQEVSAADVRRSVNFCKMLNLPVAGIIENMSGFACPKCGEVYDIFGKDGGEKIAKDYGINFLGKIPIEPELGKCGDAGVPYVNRADSHASKIFTHVTEVLTELKK